MLLGNHSSIAHSQRFGISLNKKQYEYSGGDLYRYLAGRGPLRGYTTGSAIADGLVLVGPMFWPLLCVFCFATFFLYDGLMYVNRSSSVISIVALLSLYDIFMWGILKESMALQLTRYVRDYPAIIITYAVLFVLPGAFDRFVRGHRT